MTSIEDLSNDLFYEIFEYFEGFDLYTAFFNLNVRFQALVKCMSLRLKIYFPFETKLHFQNRLKNVIFPNKSRIVSLYIHGIRNSDAVFSSLILDSSFNRLESLFLRRIKFDILLPVLRTLTILPRLFSLTIIVSNRLVNIDDPYLLIFSLSNLKYIKLSFETRPLMELWTNNNYQLSSIQYLIIDYSCNISKLFAMLSSTPQLRHHSCQFLFSWNQLIGNNMERILPNLTHFSFYQCQLPFDQLEILMKKIASNLQVIRLRTADDRAYFNGDRWKQLLEQYIPHLRLFELKHQETINDDIGFTTDHELIHHFTSTFWAKPRWIIKFNISLKRWGLCIVFSTDPFKESRYQKNSSNFNHPSQSVVLTISNSSTVSSDYIYVDKLISFFATLPITHLIIECQHIFFGKFIRTLRLSRNLNSLEIRPYRH